MIAQTRHPDLSNGAQKLVLGEPDSLLKEIN
jgi:hypothetical protein